MGNRMIALVGLGVLFLVAVAFPKTKHYDVSGAELIQALRKRAK